VQRNPGKRKGNRIRAFDIFSRDGYYLYKVIIPIPSDIIKNGYLYTCILNEDTGEEFAKRYKIKNWAQIKEGL